MLTIQNNQITVFEMIYLLSNYDGYVDGDKQCVVINI